MLSDKMYQFFLFLKTSHTPKEISQFFANSVYVYIGMEQERDFMRAHGKKQEGQRNVLPPQIFNGEKYCGVSLSLF
jgi:SH3-binding, glutamic acid-rich protein